MYNIPPNAHTHAHAQTLCVIQWWPPAQQETHMHTRTHPAYYLYEVLYTSDHQHRVSVFSNPRLSWIGRSRQWGDYTAGLMEGLIWLIVSVFYNKTWLHQRKALPLYNDVTVHLSTAFTAARHFVHMYVILNYCYLNYFVTEKTMFSTRCERYLYYFYNRLWWFYLSWYCILWTLLDVYYWMDACRLFVLYGTTILWSSCFFTFKSC